MTKRILTGVISVSLIIMLVCVGLVMGIMYDYMGEKIDEQLKNEAVLIEEALLFGGLDYIQSLSERAEMGSRVTLISEEGIVLYDTIADHSLMENHMEREEVRAAVESGEGYATRTSDTLASDTRYYARRTEAGSIVRTSVDHYSQIGLLLDTFGMVIITVVILIVISLVISYRIAKAIIKPINDIDLDNPEIRENYEELRPLLHRIHHQNIRIRKQMDNLRKQTEEFNIITENMAEGLIILDKDGVVLSYNRSALKMIGEENLAAGKVISDMQPEDSFTEAVADTLRGGDRQIYMEKGEDVYEVICSSVKDGQTINGAVIIILDVTEKEKGEKLRREFTSNVSHELKTPLTSVYGISDMLASGMVKPEDVTGFAATIKEESSRLISLIDDIINLSRLDEGSLPKEMEAVDVACVAENVASRLSSKAYAAEVELICNAETSVIKATEHVVDEIIYNLAENAIKYNRPGGSVKISVANVGRECVLRVEDTGIGISEDDQQRVFERFFRADKSHSRNISGTGLGLSIVKHATAYLNGEITLESEEGKGTTVIVVFPCADIT